MNLIVVAAGATLLADERARDWTAERLGLAREADLRAVSAGVEDVNEQMLGLASEIDDATTAADALAARLDDLEGGFSVSELQSEIDDLESSAEDVAGTVEGLCDAIRLNWIYSNTATEALLSDLYSAC